ncbi:MAG: M3 family oligoendopeptidase [Verrucomicrobiota bacterium]|nr:M3 family oligoendopeptidase [Verrucomicrobiota bacterium]
MDWTLASYFPTFDGPELKAHKADLTARLSELTTAIAANSPLTLDVLEPWEAITEGYEAVLTRFGHYSSYVGCLVAADALNEGYQAEEGRMADYGAEVEKVAIALKLALAEATDETVDALLARSGVKTNAYFFQTLRAEAIHRMSSGEESLAADLSVDGIHAWSRFYNVHTGRLKFTMSEPDGSTRVVPFSQRNSLIAHANRYVRKAAFTGANTALEQQEHLFAAALNAIAGTRLKLNARRNLPHFLDTSLLQSRLSRASLDAMFQAIEDTIEIPRAMLRWRAAKLGQPGITYFDLQGPLDLPEQHPIGWHEAVAITTEAFTSAYPALGAYFADFIKKQWIDYTPRDGKRPGGFCTGSEFINEQRIFMTYNNVVNDLMTLAHEAGHAWHSQLLTATRPLARLYPMTLAETASTFAELLLTEGVLRSDKLGAGAKAALLDSQVRHAAVFLTDLPVRYLFEKRFYEERANGEVSASRLKEIMVQTQRAHFGDCLAPDGEDPYFWASKMHFYISDVQFYNYPYTFGYLLSASLFARFKAEGSSFLADYEKLLMATGSGSCETVVQNSLGEDITQPAFWTRAILSLETPFAALRELAK